MSTLTIPSPFPPCAVPLRFIAIHSIPTSLQTYASIFIYLSILPLSPFYDYTVLVARLSDPY